MPTGRKGRSKSNHFGPDDPRPKKGRERNTDTVPQIGAYFCTTCHQILIHRCPQCWHEQESGGCCEECGANFALYWELAFERAVERENRIWWDRFKSAVANIAGLILWPITTLGGLLRYIIIRLVERILSSSFAWWSGFFHGVSVTGVRDAETAAGVGEACATYPKIPGAR